MRGVPAVLALATFQFAAEGLVPLSLMVIHGERFSSYGFKLRNAAKSIVLAMVLAALYDLELSWQAEAWLWVPLYRHTAVRLSLAAGLPLSLLGLAVTIVVWGWLEGFFGVFFARRVDQALGHDGTGWLDAGAVAFGLFNGALHLAIGQGLVGFLTSFASGYVIGVIPAVARNAWGSTVFQSLTNSIGRL
jgi:hypothetical protein